VNKPFLTAALLARVALTLIVVAIAAFVLWRLVDYYTFAPWTRDGRVTANVVQVAPDVSGLIVNVGVVDNQEVKQGQILFTIDPARFALALRQAEATALQRKATLDQARREYARNKTLGDLVAQEVVEESLSRVQTAEAAYADAQVAIGVAQLNQQRATVLSPVDGYLSDQAPRNGEYVTAGRSVMAIVDTNSFRVDGYFEETKLRDIAIGQGVTIQLMGEDHLLHGHVQSIVSAIEDRDRMQSSNLLPNVNPAFSWVRLAQRIPVRVKLDEVPADFRLIAGRTATVSIDEVPRKERRREEAALSASSASSTSQMAPASSPASPSTASSNAAAQPTMPASGHAQ
jgi:multidrug resistance efflux pump